MSPNLPYDIAANSELYRRVTRRHWIQSIDRPDPDAFALRPEEAPNEEYLSFYSSILTAEEVRLDWPGFFDYLPGVVGLLPGQLSSDFEIARTNPGSPDKKESAHVSAHPRTMDRVNQIPLAVRARLARDAHVHFVPERRS